MPSHYGGNRKMNGNGRRTTSSTTNNNQVTALFNAPQSPRYYRSDGSIVPVGAPLHRHSNGTVMTKHAMGANDNSEVVTTRRTPIPPQNRRVNRIRYTFVDTNQEYIGKVVEIGGILYSTDGGVKEGTSREVKRSINTASNNSRTIRRNRTTPTTRLRNNRMMGGRTLRATRNNRRRANRRVGRQNTNTNNGTRRNVNTMSTRRQPTTNMRTTSMRTTSMRRTTMRRTPTTRRRGGY
jgi:hypothetical protein